MHSGFLLLDCFTRPTIVRDLAELNGAARILSCSEHFSVIDLMHSDFGKSVNINLRNDTPMITYYNTHTASFNVHCANYRQIFHFPRGITVTL